jgi:flavin-dependent dehydrogenase
VIVIGAGPGGSGVAAGLAARGWRTLLIERGILPRHRVCGEFLSPEAAGSLEALGIVLKGAVPITEARLSGPRGESMRFRLGTPALGISRASLDHQVAEAAVRAGAELRTGVTARHLERSAEGWRVQLREGAPLAGRLVVGAWGRGGLPGLRTGGQGGGAPVPTANSAPSTLGRHPRFVGVKLHLLGIEQRPAVELAFFPGGYGGLAPVEGGRTNLALLMTPERFRQSALTPEVLLAGLPALAPRLADRLRGAEFDPASWRVVAGVATDRANEPWDRVPLVGDAATMIPPLAGDGMAMALGAATLLVDRADRFLAGALSMKGVQQGYATVWHRSFDRRLLWGRRLQRLLLATAIAGPVLAIGGRLPGLGPLLFRLTRGRSQ